MTVVVGHPTRQADGGADRSAIALGAMLARTVDTDLLAVSVVPAPWPTATAGGTDREYVAWVAEFGAAAVRDAEAALAGLAPDLATRAISVSGRSVPQALLEQVRESDAGMLVVGSADDGRPGRVALGSTADHLLHAAHVPVALAPHDFTPGAERVGRATCAFRADRASQEVLARTAEICAGAGAEVRAATFGVRGKTMYPPEVPHGEQQILEAFVEQARGALGEALTETGLGALEPIVATGATWQEALAALDWRDDEVLVLGSSSRSLLSRVFLGSRASRIIRHSPVPVVVVPES